jgi:hypothetical protein
MTNRTYLDSGVLLAAFKGEGKLGLRALEVLDDPNRCLVVSDAVEIELLPKPVYEKTIVKPTSIVKFSLTSNAILGMSQFCSAHRNLLSKWHCSHGCLCMLLTPSMPRSMS